jgi:hypothetical protein
VSSKIYRRFLLSPAYFRIAPPNSHDDYLRITLRKFVQWLKCPFNVFLAPNKNKFLGRYLGVTPNWHCRRSISCKWKLWYVWSTNRFFGFALKGGAPNSSVDCNSFIPARNGGVAPLVLNLALYEWVRTVSVRLLKPEEITEGVYLKGALLAFRARSEAMDKTSFLQQAGIEPPFLGRAALSQLLCWLSCSKVWIMDNWTLKRGV